MAELIHNVEDRRHGWIGSWESEPLVYANLKPSDAGRTIIYQPNGRWRKMCVAEAGTLTSWRDGMVFARYTTGDTAAASMAENCCFGIRRADDHHPDVPSAY